MNARAPLLFASSVLVGLLATAAGVPRKTCVCKCKGWVGLVCCCRFLSKLESARQNNMIQMLFPYRIPWSKKQNILHR